MTRRSRKGGRRDPLRTERLSRKTRSEVGRVEHHKGLSREDAAFAAFDPLGKTPDWFTAVRRPTQEQDGQGIDLIVESDVGDLYIQIKSSRAGAKDFAKKPRRKLIRVIVIKANSSDQSIRDKVIHAASSLRQDILSRR